MLWFLDDWLRQQGIDERAATLWTLATEVTLAVALALAADFVAKRILVRGATALSARTTTDWDDALIRRRTLHRIAHLAPAMVLYQFAGPVFEAYPSWIAATRQICLIYMSLVAAWSASATLDALDDIARTTTSGRDLPTRSFVQVGKIVLFGVTAIAVVSLLIGRSPVILFSGLGAMTAVLMLVFKDPILGFVAGIQLSANQMVARGDWIEMPKYGADGDVVEVALTTVKVRNWDKTISTVPTYALISESFKNWRGMSESGGRRIKRAIHIDLSSIRFCDREMLDRFRRIQYMAEYLDTRTQEIATWNIERKVDPVSPANGRQITNVGTFRAYIEAYLRHHPMVNLEMTLLVRQLAPTAEGLPIEIYVFSRDTRWAVYEDVQANIFDHVIAAVREFDLRLYQKPAGSDVTGAVALLADR